MEDYISQNTNGFLDPGIIIEVSLDELCSMRFMVNAFSLQNSVPLEQYSQNFAGGLQNVMSAPIGIPGLSIREGMKEVMRYLDSVLDRVSSTIRVGTERDETVPMKTMEILLRFHRSISRDVNSVHGSFHYKHANC
jgi:hypothetical protein